MHLPAIVIFTLSCQQILWLYMSKQSNVACHINISSSPRYYNECFFSPSSHTCIRSNFLSVPFFVYLSCLLYTWRSSVSLPCRLSALSQSYLHSPLWQDSPSAIRKLDLSLLQDPSKTIQKGLSHNSAQDTYLQHSHSLISIEYLPACSCTHR